MDIRFDIANQTIKQKTADEVVNLSDHYLNLIFNFKTDDWDGLTKFILIHHAEGVTRFGLNDDEITLAAKYLASRKLKFTLYGVTIDDGVVTKRITTNMIRLPLIHSGFTTDYDEDLDPVIDADIIENIWDGINSKLNISDVKDNLISTDTEKPLSANQGKILKSLVDDKANLLHDHDERYYTKSEVDEIVGNLEHDWNNRLVIDGDKSIIQTNDSVDIIAYKVKNGIPEANKDIYFYVKEDE